MFSCVGIVRNMVPGEAKDVSYTPPLAGMDSQSSANSHQPGNPAAEMRPILKHERNNDNEKCAAAGASHQVSDTPHP